MKFINNWFSFSKSEWIIIWLNIWLLYIVSSIIWYNNFVIGPNSQFIIVWVISASGFILLGITATFWEK